VFVNATYLFFVAGLIGFYALLKLAPAAIDERTGQVFYVWFSVFNLFATMLFWALMVDRFSLEQSKRLFGAIAVGGTLGAIFGPWLASMLARPLGTATLLLIAAGFLLLAIGVAWWFTRLTVMATFVYFTRLQMVAALNPDLDVRTATFAQIDMISQTATLVLQAIVTGHLMRRLGVAVTLAILPITVALGFIGLAIMGTLTALIAFEASFRAVQRGIMRPARETLFTIIPRSDRYKAKAFIDTFVYRAGDVIALAWVLVPLAMAWMALGLWLGYAQQSRAAREPEGAPAEVAPKTA
jgi:AAA family ATP:ADP antiporter